VPALHDRPEDIHILFRKFAADFANKYKSAPVQLDEEAKQLLINYPWPGNVRELKNIAEQISVLSQDKQITAKELNKFLQPYSSNRLPVLVNTSGNASHEFSNEREMLYKLFFDMKKDVTELKRMFLDILQNPEMVSKNQTFINELKESENFRNKGNEMMQPMHIQPVIQSSQPVMLNNGIQDHVEVEESLNIMDNEKELILKALKKHRSKRKDAALDLGISERTLYRKLKEYDIEE
jgi:DNA-binding NtrC family response regulator